MLKNNVVLVDGMNLFHRSLWGYKDLYSSTGKQVGAIYGFISMLFNIVEITKSKNIIIVFEGANSWRKLVYKEYKAKRLHNYDDDEKQRYKYNLNAIKFLLKYCCVNFVYNEKHEADDLIFILTKIFKKDIKIVSGDKDFFQLINDENNIAVLRPIKNGYELIKENDVFEKFGVYVPMLPFYFALIGDKSDNITGIKGVGNKKALNILRNGKYGLKEYLFNCNSVELSDFKLSFRLFKFGKTLYSLFLDNSKFTKLQTNKINKLVKVQKYLNLWNIRKFSALDIYNKLGNVNLISDLQYLLSESSLRKEVKKD